MPFDSLTPVLACRLLANAGFDVAPGEIRFERREQRWLITLPGKRIAWVAASTEGRRHLSKERKVLRLIEARCDFSVPKILFEDSGGEFDVRAAVPGTVDPQTGRKRMNDGAFLRAIGARLGSILAQQHTRVHHSDIEAWLPHHPAWPKSIEWTTERLPRVIDDPALLAAADTTLARYNRLAVDESDRVLIHGDVGFHNMGIDFDSGDVTGLFDYGGAAWADRHHDFRYLVQRDANDALLNAALGEYESATGRKIKRDRVLLYNAVCAICFLAFRDGIPAERRWCGRTLAEDLAWTRGAIDRCD